MSNETLAEDASGKILLTTEQVAEMCGVQVCTLEKWRLYQNNGPPWMYLGKGKRTVRYDPEDVAEFLKSRKQHPNNVSADMAK